MSEFWNVVYKSFSWAPLVSVLPHFYLHGSDNLQLEVVSASRSELPRLYPAFRILSKFGIFAIKICITTWILNVASAILEEELHTGDHNVHAQHVATKREAANTFYPIVTI